MTKCESSIARYIFPAFLVILMLCGLSACGGGARDIQSPRAEMRGTIVPGASTAAIEDNSGYKLGSGDKLRVTVFGEEDLSGEFDVTGAGKISLPLIGQVQAAGLTVEQSEEAIANKLREGYLTNPRVNIEVLNYRPFYIYGEVNKPGEYPYTNGMTILNAVAVAGGYTYRANQESVYIARGEAGETGFSADQTVKVLPGDVVRVPERFF